MSRSRGLCAVALVTVAACSFPDYTVTSSTDCSNGLQDGAETGVDCGGECGACPRCSDDMRNGDETGVDCGGSCDPCATCTDGAQNGSETDVDCGGSCRERCEVDERCLEAEDCVSLVCDRVCQPSSCNDGVRNGAETGPDCGGGCEGCENGSACNEPDDCLSARCVEQICVDAGCTDGVLNADETDEDCGGPECAPCAPPGKCELERDCVSKVCGTGGLCLEPTCEDKVHNQDETSPDCGGASCDPCEEGQGCAVATDCVTDVCLRGTCVPAGPTNQELSRLGWVLSSSETATQSGQTNVFDGTDSTYWTSGATQRAGMYVDVDLGKQTIFFKALLKDVAAPQNQDLPGFIDAYVSSDGNFGEPVRTRIQGNEWLWVDYQGPQVGRYLRFQITEPRGRNWSFGEIYVYR